MMSTTAYLTGVPMHPVAVLTRHTTSLVYDDTYRVLKRTERLDALVGLNLTLGTNSISSNAINFSTCFL
jgi:hypothetical protein